ncbi:MAG: hypothetical protein ACYC4R_03010 [Anaerolineae bacterium]
MRGNTEPDRILPETSSEEHIEPGDVDEQRRQENGAPDTIAVYDRPTGLKRLPKIAIVLFVAALSVALLAFVLYTWVL